MLVNCVTGGAMDISKLELVVTEVSEAAPKPYFALYGYCTDWFSRCLIALFDNLEAAVAERARLQGQLDVENQKKMNEYLFDLLDEEADFLSEDPVVEESGVEEIVNEAEVHTDLEGVSEGISELQGGSVLPGDAGDNLVAGDPVSADSGSTVSAADEPLDDLGKDPDVDVKDCAHCPVPGNAAFILQALIGGIKYA